jgi:DNA-binding response OmpR family regulator
MATKILVIDDEPDVVTYLRTFLEKNDFQVITASNGEEAIQAARKETPDLVTLDIMMPQESGVRFYRKMKKEENLKNVPIIVISGMAGKHLAIAKPDASFEKPVNMQKLLEEIQRLLG